MSPTTTTNEPNLNKGKKRHDRFHRGMLVGYPEFASDILILATDKPLQSVLDLDNVEVDLETFVNNMETEIQPDAVVSTRVKGSGPSDPRMKTAVEHKSFFDPEVLVAVAKQMAQLSFDDSLAMINAIIVNQGRYPWKLDPVHPKLLLLLPERLRKHDLLSLHMRIWILDLRDEKTLERALNLKFAPVFYILANIWDMTDEVVVRMFELAWDKLHHDHKLHIGVCFYITQYITRCHPEFDKERIARIEQLNIQEDKRIMQHVSTYEEEFIQEGRQEGIQVGRQEGIQVGRQEGIQVGRQEGIQVGRQEGIQKVVENMIRKGFSESDIAAASDLSPKDVSEIRHKLNGS